MDDIDDRYDLEREPFCPACACIDINHKHADATYSLPETSWLECDRCGYQWGHS